MAKEIIAKLKKKIRIMWMVIGILSILLAGSSVCNIYFAKINTFESTEKFYCTVPEKVTLQYFPQPEKRRKKV